jgi:hypothetical protein
MSRRHWLTSNLLGVAGVAGVDSSLLFDAQFLSEMCVTVPRSDVVECVKEIVQIAGTF